VVLFPGWGVSAFTYRHQIPALADAGYRATAVDLKGHGFSDKPTGRGEYTLQAMLRHVDEILGAVTQRPATVVGQSMAGRLALELALARHPAVANVVLVSPVGLGIVPFIWLAQVQMQPVLDPVAPHLIPRWMVRAALRIAYGRGARVTDDGVDEYWAPAQFPGFARALRALVHEFAWAPVTEARLAQLSIPALVLLGSLDILVRRIQQGAAHLAGARVAVIRDGGHAVNEECSEASNAAILEFLAAHWV
jgi:pimeloyl-ACP methyl ester carboxylesterase